MRTLVALNRTILIALPDTLPPLKCMQLAEAVDRTLHTPAHIEDANGHCLFDTAVDAGARVVYRK